MNKIIQIVALFIGLPGFFQTSFSQPVDLSQIWPAHWIKAPTGPEKEFGVFYFRQSMVIDSVPETLIIHTSGDNRYQLFINGKPVVLGPQRGIPDHWQYESTDVAPFLQTGKNVLAAVVWNYGAYPPDAQFTVQTAFLLASGNKKFNHINTGNGWKAFYDKSYQPIPPDKTQISGYFGAGATERMDANMHPWGWQKIKFDDSEWQNAVRIESAKARTCIWAGRWKLEPRDVSMEVQRYREFESIRMAEGIELPPQSHGNQKNITIPANTKVRLIFDQGVETTAYPVLETSGGKKALIRMKYVEAPYVNNNPRIKDKGNRNEIDGKFFLGIYDEYIADGGEKRTYQPLWWRAYRYVEMTVETKEEPLLLHSYHSVFTSYPFHVKAKLQISGNALSTTPETVSNMLEVGNRTQLLCSHETYMDCPYYEQTQFEGDTRVQALVSYYNYGDPTLARNAILQFDWSRNEEGFLSARYPANSTYYIPNYSLFWIGMLYDYMMHVDDKQLITSKMQGVRTVLHYFLQRQRPDGTIRKPDFHNFVDWSFPRGEAPFDEKGYSALVDLHVLLALQWAVKLETYAGNEYFTGLYQEKADLLAETVLEKYWRPDHEMFADTPSEDSPFSVHTNCMAILTGIVKDREAQQLMKKVFDKEYLTQPTVYWHFYLFEALEKARLGNEYMKHLDIWKSMLAAGCTTWPETTLNSRSECHAWGASPNYHFYKIILGIKPSDPGFEKILIQPSPGSADGLSGEIPHPKGIIRVEMKNLTGENPVAQIQIPDQTTAIFKWNGNEFEILKSNQIIPLK